MKKSGFTLIELLVGISIICILVALVGGGVSSCSVSDGVRKGEITKFSNKKILFKTWEGEMVMGGLRNGSGSSVANVWEFSVHNSNTNQAQIVKTINEAVMNNEPIAAKYHQKLFTFWWNGKSNYDVIEVSRIGDTPSIPVEAVE